MSVKLARQSRRRIRLLLFLFILLGIASISIGNMAKAVEVQNFQQIWQQSSNFDEASLQSVQDNDTYVRGLKVFHDDIYPDQQIKKIELTVEQKHEAVVWGLKEDEEKRYVLLMKNRSGLYWKQAALSPVEILGINARNPDERQRYALLYANQSQERIAKELAWESAANRATKEVNQGLPLIRKFNTARFSPYHYHPIVLQPNDQLDR